VNLFSLLFVTLVLVARKHVDELNAHRDIRTLELAILSEQNIAKVIHLLEGLRRAVRKSKTVSIDRRIKWRSPRNTRALRPAAAGQSSLRPKAPAE
jgi:uncharacterized membrane protein